MKYQGDRIIFNDGSETISNKIETTISATPTYLGQIAIVGTVAYIAVGLTSSDWKQITQ